MGTHRAGEPGEETDEAEERRPMPGLSDPGRVHVTLDNLVDLANFDGTALAGYGATNGRLGSPGRVDLPPAPEIPGAQPPIPAFPATPPMPPAPVDHGHPGPGPAPAPEYVPGEPRSGDALVPVLPVPPDAPDAPEAPSTPGRSGDRIPGFYAGTSTRDPQARDTGTHQAFYAGTSDPDATGYRDFWGSSEDNTAVAPTAPEAQATDPDAAPGVRSAWARPAERWLLELLALAAASAALVLPSLTVVVVVVAVVVGASLAFVRSGRAPGTLPGRIAARSVRLLHPKSSLWLPVLFSRTVLAAVAIPAGISALSWIDDHGRNGAVAAARAGAWDNSLRVAALLLCAMVLTSVGDGRRQRAAAVRRWASPATDGTLVILALSCCAVVTLVVVAVPHPADPVAERADGLGWVPPGAREVVDRARDDVVTHELDTVASCLSSRTGTDWRPSYTTGNPLDEPDVARLTAGFDPPPADLVAAVMAAHNQLAPWVEAIEIEWRDQVLFRTDRTELFRHRPVLDRDRLIAATNEDGKKWIIPLPLDVTLGLRCSAGNVF
jgi:hypothetical protein